MTIQPTATIDLDAIRANYALLKDQLNGAACAAVVKADSYGLGAVPIMRALRDTGCRTFFVAHLAEAQALIQAGLAQECELFALNGFSVDEAAEMRDSAVRPVLNTLTQIEAWARARAGRPRRAAFRHRHEPARSQHRRARPIAFRAFLGGETGDHGRHEPSRLRR